MDDFNFGRMIIYSWNCTEFDFDFTIFFPFLDEDDEGLEDEDLEDEEDLDGEGEEDLEDDEDEEIIGKNRV